MIWVKILPHEPRDPNAAVFLNAEKMRIGSKVVALALIDALAQTKSLSGKRDPRYEDELMKMVMECIEEAD